MCSFENIQKTPFFSGLPSCRVVVVLLVHELISLLGLFALLLLTCPNIPAYAQTMSSERMISQAGGNPEEIITTYKRMMAECQQIAQKINEVSMARFDLLPG